MDLKIREGNNDIGNNFIGIVDNGDFQADSNWTDVRNCVLIRSTL